MYTESRQPVFKDFYPKDAKEVLDMNDFPGQRPYNPSKGKYYADNMECGAHRRIEIAIAKVRETNRSYLMNGQHNAHAIIINKKPFPAVISYFICDTMEDAWRLFATFDVHPTRTEVQFMKSRRDLFSDERLRVVPLRILQCCGTALYALGDGTDPQFTSGTMHAKTDKADLVNKYADDVMFVDLFKEHKHLVLVGCVMAMISTRRKNEDAALNFWIKVGNGEELTGADHRKKLRESLIDSSFLGPHNGGFQRQKATYVLCISWWNSWRAGKPRNSVKINGMNGIPQVAD